MNSASDEEPEVFEESYIMEVFLTGRAVRSEISLKNLSPEDREKFNISMQKEWDSWNRFQAVEGAKARGDQVFATEHSDSWNSMGAHRQEQQAETHCHPPWQEDRQKQAAD